MKTKNFDSITNGINAFSKLAKSNLQKITAEFESFISKFAELPSEEETRNLSFVFQKILNMLSNSNLALPANQQLSSAQLKQKAVKQLTKLMMNPREFVRFLNEAKQDPIIENIVEQKKIEKETPKEISFKSILKEPTNVEDPDILEFKSLAEKMLKGKLTK